MEIIFMFLSAPHWVYFYCVDFLPHQVCAYLKGGINRKFITFEEVLINKQKITNWSSPFNCWSVFSHKLRNGKAKQELKSIYTADLHL